MSSKLIERIKQALLAEKLVNEEQLKVAERDARVHKESLGKVLVKYGYVSEDRLANFIAEKLQIPYIDLKKYTIDPKVLELIPEKIAHRCNVMPLFLIEDVLTIATSDPLNVVALDELAVVTGYKIEPTISSSERINVAINQWYGVGDERRDLIDQLSSELRKVECIVGPQELDEATLREIRVKSEENEIVEIVNSLIVRAILENATDIHLEPRKNALEIRFRIDGVLFPRFEVPPRLVVPFTTRIKSLAGLNIAKRRIAQDGWTRLSVRNQLVDLQVSVFPTLHGENIVLKITNKTRDVPSLSELGLSSDHLNDILKVCKEKRGLILVSGPNGSGKSTTIYSALKGLTCPERNIMTIEDPIECELAGAIQGQVDAQAGITYPEALSAILRQDPDIIYVGEIRDFETAGLVIRATLSGHLLFSTIHANNSFESLTRLYDMGITPGLLESALTCSISQRLVRKICLRCKKEYRPPEKTLIELGLPSESLFFKGEGCQHCNDSGYKGLTGLFEVLVVTKEIRKLIAHFTSEEEIMDAAWSKGMKSLFDDGMSKVLKGITTIDEVKKLLYPHFIAQVQAANSSSS
jgi:type IV pilus assembly protein PilB